MSQEQIQKKIESLPQEVVVVFEDCVRAVEDAKEWFKLNYKRKKKQDQNK